jgi:hypothetical protein
MLFRAPTDDPAYNQNFYDPAYSHGFTTDLPSDAVLAEAIELYRKRKGLHLVYRCFASAWLKSRQPNFRFWGSLGVRHQLAAAGFQVTCYEVAPRRRKYAKVNLGVDVVSDMEGTVQSPTHRDGTTASFLHTC